MRLVRRPCGAAIDSQVPDGALGSAKHRHHRQDSIAGARGVADQQPLTDSIDIHRERRLSGQLHGFAPSNRDLSKAPAPLGPASEM